jgi:hypothetical protein
MSIQNLKLVLLTLTPYLWHCGAVGVGDSLPLGGSIQNPKLSIQNPKLALSVVVGEASPLAIVSKIQNRNDP